MKLETARRLVKTAHDMGHPEEHFVLRESYSGRGMCGRPTAAVEVRWVTSLISVAAAATTMMSDEGEDPTDFVRDLSHLLSDHLGLGVIVY